MSPCVLAGCALLAVLAGPAGPRQTGDALPDEARLAAARTAIERGLLSQAEVLLLPVAAGDPRETRGSAELLLGNVAFERGEADAARRRYAACLATIASLGAGEAGASLEDLAGAARANLERAETLVDRAEELDAASSRIAWITAGVLLAEIAALAWLGARAPAGPRSAAPGRAHPEAASLRS